MDRDDLGDQIYGGKNPVRVTQVDWYQNRCERGEVLSGCVSSHVGDYMASGGDPAPVPLAAHAGEAVIEGGVKDPCPV